MTRADEILTSPLFASFLEPGLDRCAFIARYLAAREIPHTVVELAGRRHIVVRFDQDAYDPRFRMKTLVAHYDRAKGSPGANDNSAACFLLLRLAASLASPRGEDGSEITSVTGHNVRVFFTDGEEAAGTKGIAGQGSYALGAGFRKLKLTEDDVYVFDACGRGETLVLSTAGIERRGALGSRLAALHERATGIAREVAPEGWMRLVTPYSDNAGFLAAGIASQVITVLPRAEAETLARALQDARGTGLEAAIVANAGSGVDRRFEAVIPETWRRMHTEADTPQSLSAQAFGLMERFLVALATRRESAI